MIDNKELKLRNAEIKKLCGDRYSYEKIMENDELYGYVNGTRTLWSDLTAASVEAGCLKMNVVFRRGENDGMPIYEAYVKESPDAKDWIFFGRPDEDVTIAEGDFEEYILAALERFREENSLSYTDPDFETIAGKIAAYSEKAPKNEGIAMI